MFLSFGRPSPLSVGVKSDTFVPKLKETVLSCFKQRQPIGKVLELVAGHIAEEIAPFVIVIPKRKSKKKKNKEK